MILAYAIILLVLLAVLLGRDLSAIGKIPFRGGWMLVGVVIALYILQAVLIVYAPGQTGLQMILLILSQLALIFLLLLNRHVPGARLFALGLILNAVVIITNGGWMPITPETYHFVHPERPIELYTRPPSSKNIILPRSETNLWLLSDIIPVSLWRRWSLSIGDLVLVVGAAQFIFQTTSTKRERSPNDR